MAAKPRRTGDQPPPNTPFAAVRHQKLCLAVDMPNRRLYGLTELTVAVPEGGVVGLHAGEMSFESVRVDGEAADFDYYPVHRWFSEDENRWRGVTCPNSAADAAASVYRSALDREINANLIVYCGASSKPPEDSTAAMPSVDSNGHAAREKNVKVVRIDYWVEESDCGIHFRGNVLHTNSQKRRARCWFPCVDDNLYKCGYDMEVTVDSDFVAVSNGTLLHQVMSKDVPPRKTYVYKLIVPVNAGSISLAVAPFEVFPDRSSTVLSYFCMPDSFPYLRNTVGFFHPAFSHYEDYLSASFPFGSYNQLFIRPDMVVTPMSLGASMCIFSSQLLFDEKVIDQIIDTRIKMAYALAKQWFGVFIIAENPNDEWLIDGLAGFLTDTFIQRFLGNNEAKYRRYKASLSVLKADVSGATALSSNGSSSDLHGTQSFGFLGKIRSRKAVAILQMLEKQMGPESFCKILQVIVSRAQDKSRSSRAISTKEFRHFANKIGNLERPFLKEFFPCWVESCGCPILRMAFSYNKRRNLIELAVCRGCTAASEHSTILSNGNSAACGQEKVVGWPGMMGIRVHELDGMYDHPSLPMTGDTCQLLEIQCHSKLASKKVQKPKKGSRADGSEDNGDTVLPAEARGGVESPLHWARVDPEMEFLVYINFHQPVFMWINQLEKDKDVVAQSQAIAALETLAHSSFHVVTALNKFLCDAKAFWRVRVEAALALAHTASEENDWAGLQDLFNFYKSRRFDAAIGLPRPNDFHDFQEYFVLEAVSLAVGMVRTTDKKSPHEAVEFILQMLKFNDNHGNPYSDAYWLAVLVHAAGELDFGYQSMQLLSSLLKHIDRLLQFDRLMPSYNGILTISCIRSVTQIALKLSPQLQQDHVLDVLKPYLARPNTPWQVRIEACMAFLELEFYYKGVDASLNLYLSFIDEEPSFRGQVKFTALMMRLCQLNEHSAVGHYANSTLVHLLSLLDSQKAFNNVLLRHGLFSILQTLAQRPPTLYGVSKAPMPVIMDVENPDDLKMRPSSLKLKLPTVPLGPSFDYTPQKLLPNRLPDIVEPTDTARQVAQEKLGHVNINSELVSENFESTRVVEASKARTSSVSNGPERKIFKIRLKPSAASSRVEEGENDNIRQLSGVKPYDGEVGPSSIISVDGPPRSTQELTSPSYQNIVDVHSSDFFGSSTKGGEINRELQCTADSKSRLSPRFRIISPTAMTHEPATETLANSFVDPLVTDTAGSGKGMADVKSESKDREKEKHKKKEKHKNKKRKRKEDKRHGQDGEVDLEYLEKKRLKKQKKKEEKERAKAKSKHLALVPSVNVIVPNPPKLAPADVQRPVEPVRQEEVNAAPEGVKRCKLRIKVKSNYS